MNRSHCPEPACFQQRFNEALVHRLQNADYIAWCLDIPPRFQMARAKDVRLDNVLPNENGLLLTGATGTGKTYMAVIALIEWIRAHRPLADEHKASWHRKILTYLRAEVGHFTTIPDLLLRLRASFNGETETEEAIVRQFSRYRILVLDDLGAEKTTDYSLQSLYNILNARLNFMRPTIVTTNLSLPEIARVDQRIASRLASFRVMNLTGGDRRVKRPRERSGKEKKENPSTGP